MPARSLPGLGLTGFWDLGASDWKPGMDANLRVLSALVRQFAKSRTTPLPDPPSVGDIYIVPSDDLDNPNKIAIWDGPSGAEAWTLVAPLEGMMFRIDDESIRVEWDGSAWATFGGGGGGATALDDLTDVAITTPATAEFLRYNGTGFVNAAAGWTDITGKPSTFAPAAHTHPATDVAGSAIETIAGTTYTQIAADKAKWKRTTNAGAVTITIAANVNSADDEITFSQGGTGQITFAAGAGMTLNSRGGALNSAGQYAVMGVKFISATEATLFGDIT